MVKIQNIMYRSFFEKRIKATVLFATETGKARNYANIVKEVFGRVFASKVCCMEDYDKTHLEHEQLVIIVTSTFGSGDPPANGEVCNSLLFTSQGLHMQECRRGLYRWTIFHVSNSKAEALSV